MTRDASARSPPVAFAAAAALVVAAYYGGQYQMMHRARRRRVPGDVPVRRRRAAAIARGSPPRSPSPCFGDRLDRRSRSPTRCSCASCPTTAARWSSTSSSATFLTDTAAYAGGRLFGRHRLAPEHLAQQDARGPRLRASSAARLGFWFAGPLPGLAAGHRRADHGHVHRARGPGGRPVRVDAQARSRDQGHGQRSSARTAACSTASTRVLFTIVVGYYLAVAFLY